LTVVRPFDEQVMLLPFPKHTLDSHLLSTQWVRRVYDFYSVRMCVTWCIHHPASRTGLETFALIRLLNTQAIVPKGHAIIGTAI
jgi:hypothetical protein